MKINPIKFMPINRTNTSFGSSRAATPFKLKELLETGAVKLSKDFFGNDITIPPPRGKELTVHHLVEVSRGGSDDPGNLVIVLQDAHTHIGKALTKDTVEIKPAREYVNEVSQIKHPEFDGEENANKVRNTLLSLDIYLDAPGVKKRRIDRPVKTHNNRQFRKF